MRRLVLSNSHGGNRHALDTAGLRLRAEQGLLVVKANYFLFPHPDGGGLPDSEWRHGLHGGAVETAMMLHLQPRPGTHQRGTGCTLIGTRTRGCLASSGPRGRGGLLFLARA